MDPIILASGSLQRQEYFRLLGLPFSIMPSDGDETIEAGVSPKEAAEELAAGKVRKVIDLLKGRTPPWIAGADTLIYMEGQFYGKPKDREDARRMLSLFRGREHEVVTGIALYNSAEKKLDQRSMSSTVTFSQIKDSEIEWYLNSGEWQGAAGAYRIQGLAACFISKINGSYSSIVGLPLHEFYGMLKDNGYPYGGSPGE